MKSLKGDLFKFCEDFIEGRLNRIRNNIASLQESYDSETKSSAGDKHETGRAMLHLEREKLGQQLADAERIKALLSKVPALQPSKKITLGHWVKTSEAEYFLAISAGVYKAEAHVVFCISAGTPIGQLLLGKAVGDSIVFNGKTANILACH